MSVVANMRFQRKPFCDTKRPGQKRNCTKHKSVNGREMALPIEAEKELIF
jgi:hypothetical protein